MNKYSVKTKLFWLTVFVASTALLERFLSVIPLFQGDFFVLSALYLCAIYFVTTHTYRCHVLVSKANWFFGAYIFLLMIASFVLYPHIDSGALGFASDRDEALSIGVKQMAQGLYPYYCKAALHVHEGCPKVGNPIAPMPGGLMLSLPFAITHVWLQSIFWLSMLFVVSKKLGENTLKNYMALLLLSPIVVAETISGGDHIANGAAVAISLSIALSAQRTWVIVLASVLYGVALSWRSYFFLTSVPVAVYLMHSGQWRRLLILGTVSIMAAALVVLPFYWYDPEHFSPFTIQKKLEYYKYILANPTHMAIMASVAIGLVTGCVSRSKEDVYTAAGITAFVPILFAIVLNAINEGKPTISFYGWYGLTVIFLLFFGAFGESGQRATGGSHS